MGITGGGKAAVMSAGEKHPDIILMNIVPKGSMNGIEATCVICEENEENGGRIIYMTAHADENTLRSARETKYVGFLFKPFEAYQLKKVFKEAQEQ